MTLHPPDHHFKGSKQTRGAGRLLSLHYRSAAQARSHEAVINLEVTDTAATARSCPALAEKGATDNQLIQISLAGGEAMFCTAVGSYRGNALLKERLTQPLGAASSQVVGLNSTSCLRARIVGLPQSGVAKERVKFDRAEQREAGVRACTKDSGVAVRLSCHNEKSRTHVWIDNPWCRRDNDDNFAYQPAMLEHTRKELGLQDLRLG